MTAVSVAHEGLLSGKIQQGKEENPDDIDEVPIKPRELDPMAVWRQTAFRRLNPQHQIDDSPAQDVKRMQAGHAVVERPEDARARQKSTADLGCIFERFHAEK